MSTCAGGVERVADRADLAVHHPAGGDDVGAGLGVQRPPSRRRSRPSRRCRPTPDGVSTPQCPWSVNSSRQTSVITQAVVADLARERSGSPTLRMPCGSSAPEPCASLCSGTPKSMTPAEPGLRRPRPRPCAACRGVCWTTPGIELIGRGSVRPSATNTGSTSWRGSTLVSATIARIAGDVRSRRGRCRSEGALDGTGTHPG